MLPLAFHIRVLWLEFNEAELTLLCSNTRSVFVYVATLARLTLMVPNCELPLADCVGCATVMMWLWPSRMLVVEVEADAVGLGGQLESGDNGSSLMIELSTVSDSKQSIAILLAIAAARLFTSFGEVNVNLVWSASLLFMLVILVLLVANIKFAVAFWLVLVVGNIIPLVLLHFAGALFSVLWLSSVASLLLMCLTVGDLIDSTLEFIEIS